MHYSGYCTVQSVKKCEKIDLSRPDLKWKSLPDMTRSRCDFNPCLFNDYVYLCGGNPACFIEVFFPQTDSFLQLPSHLNLPKSDVCCLYVHKNCLVVHSENYITQFSAGPAGQLVRHSQVLCPSRKCNRSSSKPVLDPTCSLFFVFQRNSCYSFNMNTGAQVQEFP